MNAQQYHTPQLRDVDELEGALLLPQAMPVLWEREETDRSTEAFASNHTIHVATAIPIPTYYNDNNDEQEEAVQNNNNNNASLINDPVAVATAVPEYVGATYSDPDRDNTAAAARQGTEKGRILAEQEAAAIRRANQNVRAIHYNAKQEVERANQLAAQRHRLEQLGLTQTSYTIPIQEIQSLSQQKQQQQQQQQEQHKEPEYFPGTYGKEYDVAPYDTRDYDTKEYDVSEYKSVYEP